MPLSSRRPARLFSHFWSKVSVPPRAAVAVAGDGAGQLNGTAEFFRAAGDVECVKALEIAAVFFGGADEIHRVRGRVDDGSAGDADDRGDVGGADVALRDGCCAARRAVGGGEHAGFPERIRVGAAVGVGIEGIDGVIFGSNEDDVVRAAAGDGDVLHIERLGVNLAVYGLRKKAAEIGGSDGGRRELRFVGIRARARVVVMLRGDVLCAKRGGEEQRG